MHGYGYVDFPDFEMQHVLVAICKYHIECTYSYVCCSVHCVIYTTSVS